MERTVHNLRDAGIHNINVTTHYKPEKIVEHFGSGTRFGVAIKYLEEETPLGTAGALGLVEDSSKPLLVLNGDILTMVDFRSLIRFHSEQESDLTIGVRQYEMQVPYGVIQADEDHVTGLQEKPKLEFLVNAGVYLVEPRVLSEIPPGERFDMTDLINKLLEQRRRVVSFPIIEYWLDIGRLDDFQRAQVDVRNMRRAA
jgi:NDP-sugar pyrophosphorylase family protein